MDWTLANLEVEEEKVGGEAGRLAELKAVYSSAAFEVLEDESIHAALEDMQRLVCIPYGGK